MADLALAAAAAADLPTSIPSLAAALTLSAGGFAFRPADPAGLVLRDGDAVALDLASGAGGGPPAAALAPVAKRGRGGVEAAAVSEQAPDQFCIA